MTHEYVMNENFRDRIEFRFPRNRDRNLMNALTKNFHGGKNPPKKIPFAFFCVAIYGTF